MDRLNLRFTTALLLLAAGCFNPNDADTETSTGNATTSSSTSTTSTTISATSDAPTTTRGSTGTTDDVTASSGSGTSGSSGSSTSLTSGSSGAGPTCSDGETNADETDIDCGGPDCPPCAEGQMCAANTDCVTQACTDNLCVPLECTDAAECPEPSACHERTCVDFMCGEAPLDGVVCDDGLVCTLGDKCEAGVCKSTAPKPISLADVAINKDLGLTFDGPINAANLGIRIIFAGDFNGDTHPDFAVLANKGSGLNPRVYIVFGGDTLESATLADIAMEKGGGVLIEVDTGDAQLVSLASIGDFNKDGFGDIVIGTPAWKIGKGGVHVVFGGNSPATIKLSNLPPNQGVSLEGGVGNTDLGVSVAGLGDLNGDSYPEIAVGAPKETTTGSVYIVYGAGNLVTGTFANYLNMGAIRRIQGPMSGADFGRVLAGVGDINKSGVADLAVGVPSWSNSKGRVIVLYLPKDPFTNYQVTDPLPMGTGVVVNGHATFASLGSAIAPAADFNGDGTSDFVIGGGGGVANKAIVVLGSPTLTGVIDGSQVVLTNAGFQITGGMSELLGVSVGGSLDINGDGRSDVLLGATGATGRVYVAFGRPVPFASIPTSDLAMGKGGFAIEGEVANNGTGISVAPISDMNGDGHPDILVGARYHPMATNNGRAYLVYGGECQP